MQVWGLGGEDLDPFGQVAVRGGPGHAEPGAEQGLVLALAEPRQDQNGLVEAGQRTGPVRVPRARRSAVSSRARYWTSSLGTSSMAR